MSKSRIYITALGKGGYNKEVYSSDGLVSAETEFAQIATLAFWKCSEWSKDNGDKILLLVTKDAKKNCLDDLKTEMQRIGISMDIVVPKDIPEGKDSKEIMEIFMKLNEEVAAAPGAEIYFDVTCGFRYLPMLVVVFNNYSRFVHNTECKEIAYGSLFAKVDGMVPVVSLNWLDEIQQWTTAAENLITSGNAEKLAELTNKENRLARRDKNKIARKLEDVTKELQTCRGHKLIDGKAIKTLLKQIDTDKLSDMPKPFIPILDKIKGDFSAFDGNGGWKNGLYGAKWCCDHRMYQQAVTLLRETGITYLCMHLGMNWEEEDDRNSMVDIVRSLSKRKNSDSSSCSKMTSTYVAFIRSVPCMMEWAEVLDSITNFRNNYNHAGMLKDQEKYGSDKIIKNIKQLVDTACKIDYSTERSFVAKESVAEVSPIFINLSNHPSEKWAENQLHAASEYGSIVDLPFPQVSPAASQQDISTLADETVNKVRELTSGNTKSVIHIMGEMSLTYRLVMALKNERYRCVCSTTERMSVDNPDGTKTSTFNFKQFREY